MNYHLPRECPDRDDGVVGASEGQAVRIALFNVKYSPNLGDGIIAECLENELSRIRPNWQVESIDLAGREEYGAGLDASRGRVLRLLETLPSSLRTLAAAVALSLLIAMKYRPRWRRALAGVKGAIVGGGQLFADADLNFPLKLRAALAEVSRVLAPGAVFGVGVAREMSKPARSLFLSGLHKIDLCHVAVRDGASRYNWNRHFSRDALPQAELCRDPGLLAGEIYPSDLPEGRDRPLIGIGIVNPQTLDIHSLDDDDFSARVAREFWARLSLALLDAGFDVTLFTNGPRDDELFLNRVLEAVQDPRIGRAPRPRTPSDLAATIAGFDGVAAHRLHACILAYAFRIPHVGLSWDLKLEAFFASVGRSGFVANHTEVEADEIAVMVEKALAEGIDPASHASTVATTRDSIERCALALEQAIGGTAEGRNSKVENAIRA